MSDNSLKTALLPSAFQIPIPPDKSAYDSEINKIGIPDFSVPLNKAKGAGDTTPTEFPAKSSSTEKPQAEQVSTPLENTVRPEDIGKTLEKPVEVKSEEIRALNGAEAAFRNQYIQNLGPQNQFRNQGYRLTDSQRYMLYRVMPRISNDVWTDRATRKTVQVDYKQVFKMMVAMHGTEHINRDIGRYNQLVASGGVDSMLYHLGQSVPKVISGIQGQINKNVPSSKLTFFVADKHGGVKAEPVTINLAEIVALRRALSGQGGLSPQQIAAYKSFESMALDTIIPEQYYSSKQVSNLHWGKLWVGSSKLKL